MLAMTANCILHEATMIKKELVEILECYPDDTPVIVPMIGQWITKELSSVREIKDYLVNEVDAKDVLVLE